MNLRFAFRRAIALHPLTWIALLGVIALFLWLNFNTTRVSYLEHTPTGWHGGVRQGFPIPWWDAGSEAAGTIDGQSLMLHATQYGGWKIGGVVLGLTFMLAVMLGAAFLSELLTMRIFKTLTPPALESLRRPVRIRLLTGLVVAVLFIGLIMLNLIATTSATLPAPDYGAGASTETAIRSESMGWPFVAYVAHNPVLVSATAETGKALTAKQDLQFMERRDPIFWSSAHWNFKAIVLNVFVAFGVIVAAAVACEWLARIKRI